MINGVSNWPLEAPAQAPGVPDAQFLATFIRLQSQLDRHHVASEPVTVDGYTLSVADVVAAARYGAPVQLSSAEDVRKRVELSQQTIESKLAAGASVYGLSTGFGGSADTRTNASLVLGKSLLQHQHGGILPSPSPAKSDVKEESSSNVKTPLPLQDPLQSTSMPESWVKAAILIRMNSLIRGHSGVRWKFIEALRLLLEKNITPLVPLRGSISASGDLSPLSYVAGTLIGNPSIRAYSTAPCEDATSEPARRIVSSRRAFSEHSLTHVTFEAKEHLGLLNGTAFSAAVASLAIQDVMHVGVLSMIATALGTEALLGMQGSHDPFIHATARPHPGQVEAAAIMHRLLDGSSLAVTGEEKELSLEEDVGKLRQDRYALRTSPQWLGPLMEDIVNAVKQIETECNSTTDNPLVDGTTGSVHHGGNFQAMSISLAMDRVRLSLAHIGKLIFSQMTELLNPTMNRGLPPNLAATDPSVNYFAKGLDIAAAAYVSELGWLASPVGTHVQSAEMHNQAVNSLALISARATINALEVLTMLMSSYIYVLCQALDIRAMQREFDKGVQAILAEELENHFPTLQTGKSLKESPIFASLLGVIRDTLDSTTTMDAVPRMETVSQACTTPLVNYFLAGTVGASEPPAAATATTGPQVAATQLAIGAAAEKDKVEPTTNINPRPSTPSAADPSLSTSSLPRRSSITSGPSSPTSPMSPSASSSPLPSALALFSASSALASAATALSAFSALPAFRHTLSTRMSELLVSLRLTYLTPSETPNGPARTPAAPFLSPHTRKVYSYVREELGVRMHGWENASSFDTGLMAQSLDGTSGELGFSEAEGSIGVNASKIYESIRDGKMQKIVMSIFDGVKA